MIKNMEIGMLKLTEALVYLRPIAESHGLNLSRLTDFKMARMIFANLYCHDVIYDH